MNLKTNNYVLGLDVSTSITGVCLIDCAVDPDGQGNNIIVLDHITLKKCNTLWEKSDMISHYLLNLNNNVNNLCEKSNVLIAIEEPLLGFRQGMSSAVTIAALLRFNGIVSYIARNTFKTDPLYIASSRARKLCGVKLQKPKNALGKSQKEQVFDHMSKNDLSYVKWPQTITHKDVPWSRDATDAYVIARAACIMNKLTPK